MRRGVVLVPAIAVFQQLLVLAVAKQPVGSVVVDPGPPSWPTPAVSLCARGIESVVVVCVCVGLLALSC